VNPVGSADGKLLPAPRLLGVASDKIGVTNVVFPWTWHKRVQDTFGNSFNQRRTTIHHFTVNTVVTRKQTISKVFLETVGHSAKYSSVIGIIWFVHFIIL